VAPDGPDADLARKLQRREARLLAEAARALDPWERYRALVDSIEESLDISEMADRKVRFALVVMAGLNLGLFAVTTRPELVGLAYARLEGWLGAYLLAYALVGVYFFLQAVEALRPRAAEPGGLPDDAPEPASPALREMERVAGQERPAYERAWREVRFGELNGELARQNHALARANLEKYAALRRLYGGLRVLALLFGGLVALVGLSTVLSGVWP
jgi:hypothetical protein